MLLVVIALLLGLGQYGLTQHAKDAERNKILWACETDTECEVIEELLERTK